MIQLTPLPALSYEPPQTPHWNILLQGLGAMRRAPQANALMPEMGVGPALAPVVNALAQDVGPIAAPSNAGDMDRFAGAITRIESGGRYDLLGPVTRSGDRAYGRYQVMGANIPSWTEAAGIGRMTPEQFLANPQAQDAVFRHRFGQYVQRYGPEGAAAAWFAGEGGMNDPNRRDVLGTTVADYRRRFTAGLTPGY